MIVHCLLRLRSFGKVSLTRKLVVEVERMVTVVQEWLEGEDKLPSKAVGYGIVALTFLYMFGQIVRCFV